MGTGCSAPYPGTVVRVLALPPVGGGILGVAALGRLINEVLRMEARALSL